ncbi:MAG: Na/Pi cotransporter family protein [Planctomycetota bacterium]
MLESLSFIFGGLAFFLYGLRHAAEGLKEALGGRLRRLLALVTRRPLLGAAGGMGVAMLLQSTSATTALLASLADTGMLRLWQTLSVILGAGVGTTLVVQFITLPVQPYALLGAAAGFVLLAAGRTDTLRGTGRFLIGFGLVFFGLFLLRTGVAPLRDSGIALSLVTSVGNSPFLGILAGVALGATVQSSVASLGVILAMSHAGVIGAAAAVPVVLGANLGACAFTFLLCAGQARRGIQMALAHLVFHAGGVALASVFLVPLTTLALASAATPERILANAHTFYNIALALVFLPFTPLVAAGVRRLLPDPLPPAERWARLRGPGVDPATVIAACAEEVGRMGETTDGMLGNVQRTFLEDDRRALAAVAAGDDRVDILYEAVTAHLVRLAPDALPAPARERRLALLLLAKRLEHAGDLTSKDLVPLARKLSSAGDAFPIEASQNLRALFATTRTNLRSVLDALRTGDAEPLVTVLEDERRLSETHRKLHEAHLDRMQKGLREAVDTDAIYMDAVATLRAIHHHVATMAETLTRSGNAAHSESRES